jgi:hypothetical protein
VIMATKRMAAIRYSVMAQTPSVVGGALLRGKRTSLSFRGCFGAVSGLDHLRPAPGWPPGQR